MRQSVVMILPRTEISQRGQIDESGKVIAELTRGVYKGDAERTLSVVVTVAPVNASEPVELPPLTVIRSKPLSSAAGNSYQGQQQQ
jgi:hypothetical protein